MKQQQFKGLRLRGRQGEQRLAERIKRAEKAKREAEKLGKKADKKWENSWWDNLAEEAEGAEKHGDACGAARMMRRIGKRGEKSRTEVRRRHQPTQKEKEEPGGSILSKSPKTRAECT